MNEMGWHAAISSALHSDITRPWRLFSETTVQTLLLLDIAFYHPLYVIYTRIFLLKKGIYNGAVLMVG